MSLASQVYFRLNAHVLDSDREIIKHVRAKLKPAARKDHTRRKLRHDLYRSVLELHHEARQITRDWALL